jgi:hypothetical protein
MAMFLLSRATASLYLALAPLSAQAAACNAQSPAHSVALIELYTSEGCSSCPPADRWLGELSRRFAAEKVIALSLHVDYWDHIGWKDPFAQAQFSARQRWLSQLAAGSTIYTPEVFAGMKELRGWNKQDVVKQRIQAINNQPARAQISISMSPSGDAAVDLAARFALVDSTRIGAGVEGIVVVFEKTLSTDVRAGENKGARLKHDNVVRYWSAPVMLHAQTGHAELRQTVKLPADWERENLVIAALVQDVKAGEVLQAVSMPGCV